MNPRALTVLVMMRVGALALALPTAALATETTPHDAAAPATAPGDAARHERLSVDRAARILSAYPQGTVPVEGVALRALAVLEVEGGPGEIALLRHLLTHEGPVLAQLARRGIKAIRDRQRADQRLAFSTALTRADAASRGMQIGVESAWRARGLGPTEASCAAYAERILGREPPVGRGGRSEDPGALLDRGEATAALAALPDQADPALAVRAYEDAGQVQHAIRVHAQRAAAGHSDAVAALEDYGVEVERLVLGMLHTDRVHEPEALETLVRRGQGLTVAVLAERVAHPPSRSDQATAADALGRMLRTELRPDPLPRAERDRIRRTLWTASLGADPAVRSIAREALQDVTEP